MLLSENSNFCLKKVVKLNAFNYRLVNVSHVDLVMAS